MSEIKAPQTLTVNVNPWRVPSIERALDGWLEGTPSEEERLQALTVASQKRADWKPSEEGWKLVDQLKSYVGFRVRIQFWDPIMRLLDEGPFPLEADCMGVVVLQDGEFLQAYIEVTNTVDIPAADGYSPQGYLARRIESSHQLAPVAELYEITVAGKV